MQIASVMAEEAKPVADESGAPIARDAIDPDLVRLRRSRPKIGIVTAAGIVFLSVFFLVKLTPDRRFAGADGSAVAVTVAEIAKGNVGEDQLVSVQAEPVMAHAVRAAAAKTGVGMRVVPARGSSEKLWLVLSGDGWEQPTKGPYVGRLRALHDLPFADTVEAFVAGHPRPVFAPASAIRAGFATAKIATVSGEEIAIRDGDRVGFDVIDPSAATVVCTYNERHADLGACTKVLGDAGVTATAQPRDGGAQAYFEVAMPGAVATLTTKLEAAKVWGARVDPVTRHYDTTWGALKGSGPAGFTVGGATVPDAQLDLVGLYVNRSIPEGAYALILGEHPQDYWYVLPVTIIVAVIGLLFAWALVRAVKRDLLPARA